MGFAPRSKRFSLAASLCLLAVTAAAVLGLSACGTESPKQCFLPPSISSISPVATSAGGQDFTITVKGDFFYVTSSVQWNEGNRQTTVVSSSELTATITADDIANAGTAYVRVETPVGDHTYGCSGDSESIRFTINP